MLSTGEYFLSSAGLMVPDLPQRKQARRTGMAGPLGEMFDHGAPFLSPSLASH